MIKRLLLICALFLCVAVPASAQIVQQIISSTPAAAGGGGTGVAEVHAPVAVGCATAASCALTVTSTGTGNLIVVGVMTHVPGGSDPTSVTSAGNTFTKNYTYTISNGTITTWSTCNSVAGDTTITANFSPNAAAVVVAGEYSHSVTSGCFDKVPASGPSIQSSPFSSEATPTTSVADELLWGWVYDNITYNPVLTGTGGWTFKAGTYDGTYFLYFGVLTRIVTTTGAYSLDGTATPVANEYMPFLGTYE